LSLEFARSSKQRLLLDAAKATRGRCDASLDRDPGRTTRGVDVRPVGLSRIEPDGEATRAQRRRDRGLQSIVRPRGGFAFDYRFAET